MTSAIPAWVEQSIATMKPKDVKPFRGRLDWYLPMARRFVSRWTDVDSKAVDAGAEMDVLIQQLTELCDALELTLRSLDHFDKSPDEREALTDNGIAARSSLVHWWRFAFGRLPLPGSKARNRYRGRDAKNVALDLHELVVAIPHSAQVAGQPRPAALEKALADATRAADAIDRYREEAQTAQKEEQRLRARRNRIATLFHEKLSKTSRGATFFLSNRLEGKHYRLKSPPRQSRAARDSTLSAEDSSLGNES